MNSISNIPEKIYLPKNGFEDFNDDGALMECLSIKDNEDDIEYLRIDLLKAKEVDLEKELDSMITPELKFHKALPSLFDVAKHFFELGLKVQKG